MYKYASTVNNFVVPYIRVAYYLYTEIIANYFFIYFQS